MKKSIPYFIIGLIAIIFTALAYLIDSDTPYDNFMHTAIEFSVISLLFFLVFATLYFLITHFSKRA